VDATERPLADVTVGIQGSSFTATTEDDGKYSLDYVPGEIKVTLSKSGYTSASLELNIAQKSVYPAARVQLFEIPKDKGLHLITDDGYVSISRGPIKHVEKRGASAWDPVVRTYSIETCNLAPVPQGKVRFVDTDEIDQTLVSADPAGVLFKFIRVQMNSKNEGLQVVDETLRKVAPGMFLREFELSPGRYAIVARASDGYSDGWWPSAEKPSYAFEVHPVGAAELSADYESRTPELLVQEFWELYQRGDPEKLYPLLSAGARAAAEKADADNFAESSKDFRKWGDMKLISVEKSCDSDGHLKVLARAFFATLNEERALGPLRLTKEGREWKIDER
jgi:hypothetical protein